MTSVITRFVSVVSKLIVSSDDLRIAYRATVTLNTLRLRLIGLGMVFASLFGLLSPLRRQYPLSTGSTSQPPPSPPDSALLVRLEKLAAIDPQIYSMGANAVASAHVRFSDDMEKRNGLNQAEIARFLTRRPSVIIIVPHIVVGGADSYAANIVRALREIGHTRVLTIVTDQDGLAMRSELGHPSLRPFSETDLLSWLDVSTAARPLFLARTIHAISPQAVFVVNSRTGLDALALSGAGLALNSRLFATFFSMGRRGIGVPYGIRYPQKIWKHVSFLTDNTPMARQLEMVVPPAAKIEVLPNRITIADNATFESRLARNRRGTRRRWAWVGRIEPLKGTELLSLIARSSPNDRFDLFGPIPNHLSLSALGLALPNVMHHGVLPMVATHDFTDYRGFLFTSMFEGMPNAVLEMTQHALPIISTDVGGLSELFASDADLINWDDNINKVVENFLKEMREVMTADYDWDRVRRIYNRVENLHSAVGHRAKVKLLLSRVDNV